MLVLLVPGVGMGGGSLGSGTKTPCIGVSVSSSTKEGGK